MNDDVPCGDSVVEENVKFLRDRSNVGQRKYGVTLDRPDLTPIEWVQHLREELADALNYATVVQREMEALKKEALALYEDEDATLGDYQDFVELLLTDMGY
jgi:hypothetical protein